YGINRPSPIDVDLQAILFQKRNEVGGVLLEHNCSVAAVLKTLNSWHRGMRRGHLRGHTNTRKRLLIHDGGFNLGLLMRQLIGVGTRRGPQGRLVAAVAVLAVRIRFLSEPMRRPARLG